MRKFCVLFICCLNVFLSGCQDYDSTISTAEAYDDKSSLSQYNSNLQQYSAYAYSQYSYIASGNKIAIYKVESNGALSFLNLFSLGLTDSAVVVALAATSNHKFLYAIARDGNNDKIVMLKIKSSTGMLEPLIPSIINTNKTGTSSIVATKGDKFVYVTNSTEICTYGIALGGELTKLSCISPSVSGGVFAYGQIILSANNKYAFVTSGSSLSVIITLIRESDGTLNYISQQEDTRVTYNLSMAIPELGKFIYTALKNNNAVGQYKIESTGSVSPLTPQTVATGSEPHAVVVVGSLKCAYVTNYHSNTISIYKINPDGSLLYPASAVISAGVGPDKITVDKDGRFIYVSTLGGDKSVLQYVIDQNTGMLTLVGSSVVSTGDVVNQILTVKVLDPEVEMTYPSFESGRIIDESDNLIFEASSDEIEERSINESTLRLYEVLDESSTSELTVDSEDEVHATSLRMVQVEAGVFELKNEKNDVYTYQLDPKQDLSENKTFVVKLDVKDLLGNQVKREWSVRTSSQLGPPTMILPYSSDNVSLNTHIKLRFPGVGLVDSSSVNSNTIRVFKASGEVASSKKSKIAVTEHDEEIQVSYYTSARVVTVIPQRILEYGATYYVEVNGVRNMRGFPYEETTVTLDTLPLIYGDKLIYLATGVDEEGYTGDLAQYDMDSVSRSGTRGADMVCNTDSHNPRPDARFKAMVASPSYLNVIIGRYPCANWFGYGYGCGGMYNSGDWSLYPETEYKNINGQTLGYTDVQSLFPVNETLFAKISPYNDSIRVHNEAWTGLNLDGTTGDTCNSWATLARYSGVYGIPSSTAVSWVIHFPGLDSYPLDPACYRHRSIMCVQQ